MRGLNMGPLNNSMNSEDESFPVASFVDWQGLNIYKVQNNSNNYFNESPKSSSSENSETRRGRPKSDSITSLILSGTTSNSTIKCNVCYRVFPRLKSLQAHSRTHTGEKPYCCDFPDCGKDFAQSGQLITHKLLHSGEKPFVCRMEGCKTRFPHQNRRCNLHPAAGLRRDDQECYIELENQDERVREWHKKYWENKKAKRQKRMTPRSSSSEEYETNHQANIKKRKLFEEETPAIDTDVQTDKTEKKFECVSVIKGPISENRVNEIHDVQEDWEERLEAAYILIELKQSAC